MEKKHQLFSWLNVMVTEPYYLFHFLTFFSYFIVRNSTASLLSPFIHDRLLHRMVKQESWEGFIADTILFAKVFLVGLSTIMDYHLALWYLVVCLVIFIVTQQPAHEILGASNKLTPLQLECLLTEGNTSRFWLVRISLQLNNVLLELGEYKASLMIIRYHQKTDIMGFNCPDLVFTEVEFRALCSSACIHTSRYSNTNLSFGTVDLGLFPNTAENFGISLSGSMSELPKYILFENVAEIARFPEFNIEEKAPHSPITKRLLCRHFELDRRLLEYVNGK